MKLQIEKGVLLLGLQRVQGIIDRRSTVPILSNILLDGKVSASDSKHSTLDIVATDLEIGMRGSYPAQIHGEGAIAVSGREIYGIGRELPCGHKEISLKGEDIFITSRLIDGIYPKYKQVIPKGGDQIIRVNRLTFMNVIKRMSVMSREKTKALLIEFARNRAIIKAKDPEIGEAVEDIEIQYEGQGLTVSLNYQYVLDALDSMSDEDVMIETQTNLTPCIIKQEKDPDHICIVMPRGCR